MGIKYLWNILDPHCERKPLHHLEGKKVGIDLSGWVCESQCVVDYFVQPKMYLRNLFFRTAYLLLMGINPVFIIDGEAPQLKHQVIAKRNENNQFIGSRPRGEPKNKDAVTKPKKKSAKGRTRFNYVLKQCRELLTAMGVSCIQAEGEAEALCAYLNKDGLIDGIISQDSDCFGYGAVVVYRNFSVSKQGKSSAGNGCVDIYDMKRVEQSGTDLKQNKAVALALLCGCDYLPDGVEGVGKEAVLKLFSTYSDEEILERLRQWREKAGKFTDLELKVDDKMFCSGCGHLGHFIKHTKAGCSDCRMSKGCDTSIWKEKRLIIKSELSIRRKALEQPDFPSEQIITEFLSHPPMPKELHTDWTQPNIIKFIKSFSKHLQWTEIYSFQKILPLLTRWQLETLCSDLNAKFSRGSIEPKLIRKKRVLKGTQSFEILWHDPNNYFDSIFPEEEITAFELEHPDEGLNALWVTVEPSVLVEKAYPSIVEEFVERTTKKKRKPAEKQSRKRKKQNTSLNDMSGLLDALPKIRKKPKKKSEKGLQPITKFLSKPNHCDENIPPELPVQNLPEPLQNLTDLINIPSEFSDCSMNDSLTTVINDIVSRKPETENLGGKVLYYEDVKPRLMTRNSLRRFASPKTSTPTISNKNYLLDDTLLRRVKRKSFQKQLENVNFHDSFDDFYVNYHYSEPAGENLCGKAADADDCEQSFFFEPLNDGSKQDIFEETLNKIIGKSHKIADLNLKDLFDKDEKEYDSSFKGNRILLSD